MWNLGQFLLSKQSKWIREYIAIDRFRKWKQALKSKEQIIKIYMIHDYFVSMWQMAIFENCEKNDQVDIIIWFKKATYKPVNYFTLSE